MSFKKSIKKTKKLFLKTLENLKKIPLVVSHDHNSPKTIFLNPLSFTTINQTTQLSTNSLTNHGRDICPTVEQCSIRHEIDLPKNMATTKDDDLKNSKMKQALPISKIEPKSRNSSCRFASEGRYILAQKMKELDMIEVEEVDHVLDVEEALNYYSRLNCPVYVEIVDKFFLDMYHEFLLPQPSVNLNSSSRRLAPLQL